MDEDIFDFTSSTTKASTRSFRLTVRNPRIGLLNAGRKLWAWLSYRDSNGHVVPLFFGVLVGVPTDMFAELVQLKFNARPQRLRSAQADRRRDAARFGRITIRCSSTIRTATTRRDP
jgi:hypothetical protein